MTLAANDEVGLVGREFCSGIICEQEERDGPTGFDVHQPRYPRTPRWGIAAGTRLVQDLADNPAERGTVLRDIDPCDPYLSGNRAAAVGWHRDFDLHGFAVTGDSGRFGDRPCLKQVPSTRPIAPRTWQRGDWRPLAQRVRGAFGAAQSRGEHRLRTNPVLYRVRERHRCLIVPRLKCLLQEAHLVIDGVEAREVGRLDVTRCCHSIFPLGRQAARRATRQRGLPRRARLS